MLIDYICKVTGGILRPASDAARAEWVPRAELSSVSDHGRHAGRDRESAWMNTSSELLEFDRLRELLGRYRVERGGR